jgi:hypothetical protein
MSTKIGLASKYHESFHTGHAKSSGINKTHCKRLPTVLDRLAYTCPYDVTMLGAVTRFELQNWQVQSS